MAARVLRIIAAIAAVSILIIQVPAKTSTSILDQLQALHRTSSNETDADFIDAGDVFNDVEWSDEQRDLATTSSSDNILLLQQCRRSSSYNLLLRQRPPPDAMTTSSSNDDDNLLLQQ